MPLLHPLRAREAGLLVVDVQAKLVPRIADGPRVVANVSRAIRAAQALSIPVWATEQYPEGLGPTVPEIAVLVPHRPSKTSFSCCGVPELVEQLHGRHVRHVTVVGIEAHVCVAQTALELMRLGFAVQVPADAVGSRHPLDWEFALRRLERAGAVVSTTESVLFEWVEGSDAPAFKAISALVKEGAAPAAADQRTGTS
jgi:nicotinamidase-related amidase